MPYTFQPEFMAALVIALRQAFMPGASPPDVSTPMVEMFISNQFRTANIRNFRLLNLCFIRIIKYSNLLRFDIPKYSNLSQFDVPNYSNLLRSDTPKYSNLLRFGKLIVSLCAESKHF